MKTHSLHSWDVPPRDAIALQRELAGRVITTGSPGPMRTAAGADLGFSRDGTMAIAGVIVYSYPGMEEIERVTATGPVNYPYVPGLLSFREGPVLERAFAGLATDVDVVLFDGQGIAHPRRLGIASHLGLILDRPAIGCAKSRLTGVHGEPGPNVGDRAELTDTKTGGVIGSVLRTRARVKPIYVSVGHRISLEAAVEIVLNCMDGTRIPKPTREADKYVRSLK